ncbi:hypothetical protein QCA50_008177 [Cerrena zonata]|uniref:DUF6535 domain-containing protein n=1 Tax=Cerrena zonata TaxID=2478898 RepID=A0AAW0GBF3_9APHY
MAVFSRTTEMNVSTSVYGSSSLVTIIQLSTIYSEFWLKSEQYRRLKRFPPNAGLRLLLALTPCQNAIEEWLSSFAVHNTGLRRSHYFHPVHTYTPPIGILMNTLSSSSNRNNTKRQRKTSRRERVIALQEPNSDFDDTQLIQKSPLADQTSSPFVSDMSESNPATKEALCRTESKQAGWARLSDLIRNYDKERVEDAKEDIDTLLVLAGLFSAVITAFIVESYKTLQQQPEDTTVQILQQMSAQLASMTIAGGFVNSTMHPFTSPTVTTPRFAVPINTLWSLSLVIALITASLGSLSNSGSMNLWRAILRTPENK